MAETIRYTVTDMHTAGEPVRIFTGGMPPLQGNNLLAKRRYARERLDQVRRRLMSEPRGHADMYGVWPTEPHHPEAALAVLFTHNGGYSTMCGHATIALGRWVLDQGLVPVQTPETRFGLECPCGLVQVRVAVAADGTIGQVAFDSVKAFAYRREVTVAVPGWGPVGLDISYGGAFYAILPASRLGLSLADSAYETLVQAGRDITQAVREQVAIEHPEEAELGFLYGTILTDDTDPAAAEPTYNLCIFGDGQVDRSPTGSGVTARMALDYAKGLVAEGQTREFRGLSGVPFQARIRHAAQQGVTVTVAGQGYYSGRSEFLFEAQDALRDGLTLTPTLAQLWRSASSEGA